MSALEAILIVTVGFLTGLIFLGIFLNKKKMRERFDVAQETSRKTLEDARKEADHLVREALREAKDESRLRRRSFEDEAKKRKLELSKLEKKVKHREDNLEKKLNLIEQGEVRLRETEIKLQHEEKRQQKQSFELQNALELQQKQLENIANMSAEEARTQLMNLLKEEAEKSARSELKKIEESLAKEAEQKAVSIISLATQRLAGEYINESTITVLNLPSEEMKGRIIGREGRNIRALEQATGVDLIIDDTPEAVILSCFNPVRREIAKTTLERLIADGRIHPARIEETAKRVELEFEGAIREVGEQAAFDIGITDFHPEMIAHLGRLKFRFVGTQSVLQHSVETARISGMMASELGLNPKKAKRAGLLHDIGKSVEHEVEGHHSEIGALLCEKYQESKDVVEAVRMHHSQDLYHASALAVIVGAANTLSSNRPGARQEKLATYIKRLDDMEKIITGTEGIESAFVLQAGREVRALVYPQGVSDDQMRDIADEITSRLRTELSYPGQVRITVLRDSKQIAFAK